MSFTSLKSFYKSNKKRINRLSMIGATFLIYGLLVFQLSHIGWREVITSVPTTPLFYLIFVPIYFLLPVTELLIYGNIFKVQYAALFNGLLRKRVLNKDVLGYSGEVYFAFWAAKAAHIDIEKAAGIIKDNALGSLFAVSTWMLIILNIVVTGGGIALITDIQISTGQLVLINVGFVVFVGLLYRSTLTRLVLTLSRQQFLYIASLHLSRLIIIAGLQVLQWKVTVLGVPMNVWLLFLGLQLLVGRIPLLPSRDILFVGMGIGLMQTLNLPVLAVTSMLVTASILDKGLNFILFLLGTLLPDPEMQPIDPPTNQRS